jgi:hypothetical protein
MMCNSGGVSRVWLSPGLGSHMLSNLKCIHVVPGEKNSKMVPLLFRFGSRSLEARWTFRRIHCIIILLL